MKLTKNGLISWNWCDPHRWSLVSKEAVKGTQWALELSKKLKEGYAWAGGQIAQQQLKAVCEEDAVYYYRYKSSPEHRFHTILIPLETLNKTYDTFLTALMRTCSADKKVKDWNKKNFENRNVSDPDPMPIPLRLKKYHSKLSSLCESIVTEDMMTAMSGIGDLLGGDDRTLIANTTEIDKVTTRLTAMANSTFSTSTGRASRRMQQFVEEEVDGNGQKTGNLLFKTAKHQFSWPFTLQQFDKLYKAKALKLNQALMNQVERRFPEKERQTLRLLATILDPASFQGYASPAEARHHGKNALSIFLGNYGYRLGRQGREWKRANWNAQQARSEYIGLTLVLWNLRNHFGDDQNKRMVRCWLTIQRLHSAMCPNFLRFALAKLMEAPSVIFIERLNKRKKWLMGNTRVHYSEKKMDCLLRLNYNGPDSKDPGLNSFLFDALCLWDTQKRRNHGCPILHSMSGADKK